MTNLIILNETHRAGQNVPGYVFDGLTASQTERECFEAWIATLAKLAEEHESRPFLVRDKRADCAPRDLKPALPKLPAGPWRSLGGYFDYSDWSERERFLELDRAIAASQDLQEDSLDLTYEVDLQEGISASGDSFSAATR